MLKQMQRRWAPVLFVSIAVIVFNVSAAEAKRVALLIGNQKYEETAQLNNPANDVELMRASFEAAGFDSVKTVLDLDRGAMVKALREFEDESADADMAVVYYSGHAMEMNGVNYLIPVDAALKSDRDVEDESVAIDRVQRSLEGAKKLKLFILDACRNNPFSQSMTRSIGTRAVTRGLARVEPESADTLIAFASKAGTVALDGEGKNSPFATALSKYLTEPGLDVRIALGKVRDEVVEATNREQEPFVYGSLGGAQIFLNIKEVNINVTNSGNTQEVSPNGQSEAAADWQNIRDLADEDLIAAFIAKHGKDPVYKMLAEKKLASLQEATQNDGQDAASIAWDALKESTDAAALQRFIERYPDSTHRASAEQLIAALEPKKGLSVELSTSKETPASRDCFLLAGEPQSLPGFMGVNFLKIDAKRALSACAQAVNENPSDGMLVNLLGRAHDSDRNYVEARRNYEKAIELGNMYALTNLAWFSVYGTDGPIDVPKGLSMFEKASIAGNSYAQASLGWLYREGYGGTRQDYNEAVKWYQQSANQGYANAMATMGWFYREGLGVSQDYVQSLTWYRKAADAGDANAMSSLGWAYQNGLGTAQDYAEAKVWYEKAANIGDSYSMASLAWLYDVGNGVKQDYVEARYWYEKAANAGSAYAMGNLSRLYDQGLGTPADAKEAVRWAAGSVESGDQAKLKELKETPGNFTVAFRKEMQNLLRERGYYSGSSDGEFGAATLAAIDKLAAGRNDSASLSTTTTTTTDNSQSTVTLSGSDADQCYELAGEPNLRPGFLGKLFAQIDYGRAIPVCEAALNANPSDNSIRNMLGRAHDAAKNFSKAREHYQKAADEGNLYALTNLAWYSIYGTDGPVDMAKGTRMFEQASNAGNPYAQASLGWLYREGYNGTRKDYDEAIKWYRKGAEQGYANAQATMGWFYREGLGTTRDYTVSLDWYMKGAEGGDVNAMSSVGYAYQSGLGVSVDYVEARKWYEKAAAFNDYYSMASIGWLYDVGNGVTQDYAQARDWYEKAANGGNTYAMGNLSRLFDHGLGTRANAKEAARWAAASVEGGDQGKLQELKGSPANFTPQFRKEFQSILKQRGYYNGPIDGDFGASTQNAIDRLAART
ncbi:SEL1-like repeat protein [Shinella sp. CPCC 100929]|uniref:SEL1-like repeat protein n=1 Tax=Shinella lacus TaxID=2654216 RepID=A0ABT1RA96_9HYPH|nr:caspase family protein [Shinella lacus]MCQ4632118.1 SEL1-like repeat protein [Shinella lacus]